MKTLILASILTGVLANTAIAQPITGIGDIKIGMTEEKFFEITEIKEKNVRDISTQTSGEWLSHQNGMHTGIIWKRNKDSTNESFTKIYTPGITNYELVMSLGVGGPRGDAHNVDIKFYENSLIQIQIFNAGKEFEEILTSKYGKPKKQERLKIVVCQNKFGAKSEHVDGWIENSWGKGKPIEAKIISIFSDCGKNSASTYSIEDAKKVAKVLELERRGEQAEKKADTKAKAASSRI